MFDLKAKHKICVAINLFHAAFGFILFYFWKVMWNH